MQVGAGTTEITRTIPKRAGTALQIGIPNRHLDGVCNNGAMRQSNIQTHIRSGFTKWKRPETKELPDVRNHADTGLPPTKMKEESGLELEKPESTNETRAGGPVSQNQKQGLRSSTGCLASSHTPERESSHAGSTVEVVSMLHIGTGSRSDGSTQATDLRCRIEIPVESASSDVLMSDVSAVTDPGSYLVSTSLLPHWVLANMAALVAPLIMANDGLMSDVNVGTLRRADPSMASAMLAQSLLTAARAPPLSPIPSAFPSMSLQLSSLQASPNCPECRNVIMPELEASVESEGEMESPTSGQHVAVGEILHATPSQEVHGRGRMSIESDAADLRNSGSRMDADCAILSPTSMEMQCIGDATLVQFLRARKLHKEHFLDKVVVNEDVYERHPWNYAGGEERGFAYFCCKTKYSRRRNMRRDRMSREGGRWKQQGMVHPIVNVSSQQDAALKTYMSYIPCGKHNSNSIEQGHFLPHAPSGRLKHRHRMIEIALEEDLNLEKLFFKFKVAPKPFLVVCVLKRA